MTEEKLIQEAEFEEIEETPTSTTEVKNTDTLIPEGTKLDNGVVIYTTEDGSVYHSLVGKVTLKDAVFYKEYLAKVTEELWQSVTGGE